MNLFKNLNHVSTQGLITLLKLDAPCKSDYFDLANNKTKMQNNKEIEFKFLVDKLPQEYDNCQKLTQIYFNLEKTKPLISKIFSNVNLQEVSSARVRIVTDKTGNNRKFLVALKSSELFIRKEYEKEVSKSVAQQLCAGNHVSVIEKNRYIVNCEGYKFEFDEFLNLSKPLKTVEIEIEKLNINKQYKLITQLLTNRFGIKFKDVTFDANYKNSELAFEYLDQNISI